jgi:2-methoxy-6-polyprenyl-1,4-benzoquinol methylase
MPRLLLESHVRRTLDSGRSQRRTRRLWVRLSVLSIGYGKWADLIVGSVFSSVASSYDVMNDTMSLGIHRLWKDNFVSSLLPRLPPSYHESPSRSGIETRPPFKCLDVAGGTGDIALRILDRAREKFSCRDIEVEVVDLNQGMLDEGKKRVAKTLYYNSTFHPF